MHPAGRNQKNLYERIIRIICEKIGKKIERSPIIIIEYRKLTIQDTAQRLTGRTEKLRLKNARKCFNAT